MNFPMLFINIVLFFSNKVDRMMQLVALGNGNFIKFLKISTNNLAIFLLLRSFSIKFLTKSVLLGPPVNWLLLDKVLYLPLSFDKDIDID